MRVGMPADHGAARPWRTPGLRPNPSAEPNELEHANDGPSVPGSAAVMPLMLMRAVMPADHDAGRTGELPVSAEIRQLSRSGSSPPHCRRGRRRSRGRPNWQPSGVRRGPSAKPNALEHANHGSIRPGRCCSDALEAGGSLRVPTRDRRRDRRRSRGCRLTKDHHIHTQPRRDARGPNWSPLVWHVPRVNGPAPGYRPGKGHSLPGGVYAAKTRPR